MSSISPTQMATERNRAMKLRERKRTGEESVGNEVTRRTSKDAASSVDNEKTKVASQKKRTRNVKVSPPDKVAVSKNSIKKIKTQTVAIRRVTRSRIPKAVSSSSKSPSESTKGLEVSKTKLLTPKTAIKANTNELGGAGSNSITHYFKIDDTPKEERMNKSLLTKSAQKSVCWAKVSQANQPMSNVSDDPYEFIDELPVSKPAKRRKSQRASSTTRKAVKKMKVTNSSEEQPEKNIESNNTVCAGSSLSSIKDTSETSTPSLEISSINGTLDCSKEKHYTSQSLTIDIHSDVTPSKSDTGCFKAPAALLKKKDIFFANAIAVSTPKAPNTSTVNTSENLDQEDNQAKSSPTYNCEPESCHVGTEKVNNSNVDDRIKEMNGNISIVTEDDPKNTDSAEQIRIETEELDELEMDLENDCVLSGSFLEMDKSIYAVEDLERSSTPNNTEMFDLSLTPANATNLNETAKAFNATSLFDDDGNPFSLYGSPIQLSPIKKCGTDEKTEKAKRYSPRKILASSNKYGEAKLFSSEKKAKPKRKKAEPKDPEYEKWLKNITADLEDAENVELVVE